MGNGGLLNTLCSSRTVARSTDAPCGTNASEINGSLRNTSCSSHIVARSVEVPCGTNVSEINGSLLNPLCSSHTVARSTDAPCGTYTSEINGDLTFDEALQLVMLESNEARPRFFVCGCRSNYCQKLPQKDLQCPHSYCGRLECLEALHSQWLNMRQELLDGDKWMEDNTIECA